MNIQDRKKSLTAEELRQRYNFEDISKNKKAIQMQKDELVNTNEILNNFVEATTQNLQELQDQVDGNITTWFYSGVPTLLNEPAVEWITDTDKDKHLGDLYYDQATGYAYRFQKTNNVYSWLKLTDSDVTEALAIANAAQDTADSKRRVFVVQPTPPYDIGDIWIKDDTDLYRCKTATVEGGTYNPAHWILATNYTDDTVALAAQQALNEFKTEVEETYSTNAELITTANSISSRVEEVYTYTTTVENKTNDLDNQLTDITTTTQSKSGGNELYIEDAMEGNVLGYSVDGASEQNGTPTPSSPQEVETIPSIINLCGIPDQTFTHNGVLVTIKDGEITLDGTATASGTKNLTPIKATTLQAQQYTLSKNYISGSIQNDTGQSNFNVRNSSSSSFIFSVTLQESKKSYTFSSETSIIFGIYVYNGAIYNNYKFRPMLEEGTVAHEYIPYGYWSRVKITGKNLFSGYEVGYINSSNGNDETNNNCHRSFYIPVKPNTTYTTSTLITRFVEYNKNRGFIQCLFNTSNSITTTANTYYLRLGFGTTITTDELDVEMFEEGSTSTPYEQYKENEVLIDLKKENLFDGELESGDLNSSNGNNETNNSRVRTTNFIEVNPSTTYHIGANVSLARIIQYNSNKAFIRYDSSSNNPLTTTATTKYIRFSLLTTDTSTNVNIFEGTSPTPYYELCSNKDKTVKDRLLVDTNGNCSITKYIGERVFNGSENWGTHLYGTNSYQFILYNENAKKGGSTITTLSNYFQGISFDSRGTAGNDVIYIDNQSTPDLIIRNTSQTSVANFKTWLSTHNTKVQYELATPETITLSNTQIPLFEGINHITFVDNLETNTSVTYYRQTPLSSTYATQQQLNDVSTEKSQEIRTTRNEVIEEINSQYLKISAFNETLNDGVPIVRTETGYTFDIDGLKIEKSDNDVKSQLDNDGLSVKYKGTDILTARSAGVNTVNMTVNKFYIQRPIRMEKTKSISDGSSVGLGFYYIGE